MKSPAAAFRVNGPRFKAGDFDLLGMLTVLQAKAKELHATRIVFDGIDVLLSLLNDPIAEQREIYRIREWLVEHKLTAIVTQKVGDPQSDQRHRFLQFMGDCVVMLRHQVVDGSAFRNLRVIKYRGSGFSGDEFPIALTGTGMELTNRGPAELKYEVTDVRISSGLTRLDHMLRGGYHRGSNVLISGAPGTAKSTLSGMFAQAACKRGDRTLYVSFDEGASQIVRNLRSRAGADVVMCDVEMPGQGGLWMAEQLRERHPTSARALHPAAPRETVARGSIQS